jgi:DNA-binding beta-propeller fold protein YncE
MGRDAARRGRVRTVLAASFGGWLLAAAVTGAPPALAASTALPTQWQIPTGWLLRPAGTQVLTEREPTGLAVAPDGSAVYTVSSGIFDEGIERIDTKTLAPAPLLVGDLWLGVAADSAGDVYAGGGASDRVYRFQQAGPALLDASPAGPVPSDPARQGTAVLGWPGELLLSGTAGAVKDKLFVAGNLSVPQRAISAADSSAGPCPGGAPAGDPICSAISVLDVSNPSSPTVQHVIPVGRDAFGMAFAPGPGTLYVANWADRTNPGRADGTGTLSVVHVNPDGSGSETQHVAVGLDPTGVALSPDGSELAVADSGSDQVTLLQLDPSSGAVTGSSAVSVAAASGAPLGTKPLAVAWAPDGHLLVALAGLDAVEVLSPTGQPIPQTLHVTWLGRRVKVTSPASYIPTGWYPDALATGPNPGGGERLYVTNLYGMGAGPGVYPEAAPLAGSRTEGSVSAIDLPSPLAGQTLRRWTQTVVTNDRLAPLDDPQLLNPATDPCLGAVLPNGRVVKSRLLCQAHNGRLDPRTLHVVVLFNENKTFDAYFGDTGSYFPSAKADPQYTIYPEPVTTNHHLIAEQFNLADNFYNDAFHSSVVGHQWFESGNDTAYLQLIWAQSYDPEDLRGGREGGEWSGDATGGQTDGNVAAQEREMDTPPETIFDMFQDPADNPLGLSERVYSTDWSPRTPAARADFAPPPLWGQGTPIGGGDDETWPDTDRADLFLTGETISHNWDLNSGPPPSSFGKTIGYCGGPSGDCSYTGAQPTDYSRFSLSAWDDAYKACRAGGGSDASCQADMPNFTFMVLPQNSAGLVDFDPETNPIDPTPEAMVADNDNAVGEVIQGLSHSPFWRNTVVFQTEDDTQASGDHLDVARTYLLSAGGLVRLLGPQHQVADQRSSFSSVLRTIEILLGLPPMTLYDSTATPLADVIANQVPDQAPTYTAVKPAAPFLIGQGSTVASPAAARRLGLG